MFFNRNKKFDHRGRFLQRRFARRLQLARKYKRPVRPRPSGSFGPKLLISLGLGGRRSRAAVILGILILAYLVYVPNFLYVKTLNITGGSREAQESVRNSVNQYFNEHKISFWPQRNLVLLNKAALAVYLQAHNREIQKLDSVQKDFFGNLSIKFSPRFAKYLLLTSGSAFQISNDGVVLKSLAAGPAEALVKPDPSLVLLQTHFPAALGEGDKYLPDNFLAAAENFSKELDRQTQLALQSFELKSLLPESPNASISSASGNKAELSKDGVNQNPQQPPQAVEATWVPVNTSDFLEPIAWIKSKTTDGQFSRPFKVYLDAQSDAAKTVYRLSALLNQLIQQHQTPIAYIDMRFEERGFACLKTAACAKVSALPAAPARAVSQPKP